MPIAKLRTAAIHATMRAAAIDRVGGPEVLTLHRLPVPSLSPGEVLIALHTAGVGGWDADMRGGWWPGKRPPFPIVLGTDGSGTVVAIGSRVRRFAPGDIVYAYSFGNLKGGFYAEYVAIAAEHVGRFPKILTLREAGAIAVTGLTALQGVDDALRIKRGEFVAIHGASGAVGSLALQFAKMRGARVLATASGSDGMRFVRQLGADAAADGRHDDLAQAAMRFAPDGLDAVLAFAGGKPLTRLPDAMRRGGRIAYPNGVEPAPRKRRGIRVLAYDGEAGVRAFERLGKAIEEARLKVPIAASYPLGRAVAAHARLAKGHVLGKIVLRVQD